MINYSTPEAIRNEAGLIGVATITGDTVKRIQDQSTGIIDTGLAGVYDVSAMKASPNFPGSSAKLFLARIEELLGAGFLLMKEYAIQDDRVKSVGSALIKQAMDLLKTIKESTTKLVGSDGVEFPQIGSPSGRGIRAFPSNADDRIFTKGDVY